MEQRFAPRRHLIVYLEIMDSASGRTLGRLGDIHKDGMLILSSVPLVPGSSIPVSIRVPKPFGDGKPDPQGTIGVRWSKSDGPREGQYQSGCFFESMAAEDKARIDLLVERIGFSDGQRKILLRNGDNTYTELDE